MNSIISHIWKWSFLGYCFFYLFGFLISLNPSGLSAKESGEKNQSELFFNIITRPYLNKNPFTPLQLHKKAEVNDLTQTPVERTTSDYNYSKIGRRFDRYTPNALATFSRSCETN